MSGVATQWANEWIDAIRVTDESWQTTNANPPSPCPILFAMDSFQVSGADTTSDDDEAKVATCRSSVAAAVSRMANALRRIPPADDHGSRRAFQVVNALMTVDCGALVSAQHLSNCVVVLVPRNLAELLSFVRTRSPLGLLPTVVLGHAERGDGSVRAHLRGSPQRCDLRWTGMAHNLRWWQNPTEVQRRTTVCRGAEGLHCGTAVPATLVSIRFVLDVLFYGTWLEPEDYRISVPTATILQMRWRELWCGDDTAAVMVLKRLAGYEGANDAAATNEASHVWDKRFRCPSHEDVCREAAKILHCCRAMATPALWAPDQQPSAHHSAASATRCTPTDNQEAAEQLIANDDPSLLSDSLMPSLSQVPPTRSMCPTLVVNALRRYVWRSRDAVGAAADEQDRLLQAVTTHLPLFRCASLDGGAGVTAVAGRSKGQYSDIWESVGRQCGISGDEVVSRFVNLNVAPSVQSCASTRSSVATPSTHCNLVVNTVQSRRILRGRKAVIRERKTLARAIAFYDYVICEAERRLVAYLQG